MEMDEIKSGPVTLEVSGVGREAERGWHVCALPLALLPLAAKPGPRVFLYQCMT